MTEQQTATVTLTEDQISDLRNLLFQTRQTLIKYPLPEDGDKAQRYLALDSLLYVAAQRACFR